MPARAITIAIVAMGGEGGGVLADWIVDLAEHAGHYAQTTSVPGVAQRTGATMYYVELFPEAAIEAAGKEPVLALMPVPGEVDIVVASELMEAGRAVQRGLVTRDRTTLIASTHRVYSMTEKTAMGDGRVDSQRLLDACAASAKSFVGRDFARTSEEVGSVISAALFGALSATQALPFTRDQFEDAIRRSGIGIDRSLAAFQSGAGACPAHPASKAPAPNQEDAIVQAAIERLTDYQDARYASEYLNRLAPFRNLDADLLRETARYLALWMSYEDAIRVADLKTRRVRFDRVRRETRMSPAQLLKIYEFLHPRAAEIADILPAPIGKWLMRTKWASGLIDRMSGRGMVVETTSLRGFLQLYALAGLRRWRRRSLRFQREHRKIDAWLATVLNVAREDPALACEVAECPSLLKGYGDTHARGAQNYGAIMQVLPRLRAAPSPADKLRRLRMAALADETGVSLAEALKEFE